MILFCNDQRCKRPEELPSESDIERMTDDERETLRMKVNKEVLWCETLLERGHKVKVFDAYFDDLRTPITSPKAGAIELRKIFDNNTIHAVLYDLNYHGVFTYGLDMLRFLKESGCRTIEGPRWIVFSTYLRSQPEMNPEMIKSEFNGMIVGIVSRMEAAKREILDLLDRMDPID